MVLPADFINLVAPIFADEMEAFERALSQNPTISVRVNDKIALPAPTDKVPWCAQGFYLTQRPNFTRDPLFHAGAYYVQEASSMFLQQILQQFVAHNATVLDLCAAPGGKSTLIAQHLGREGLLVANEYVRQRAQILSENLQKWGNQNVIVTNNAPADFAEFTGLFDAILVDAPCSGEGMFRKDPNAIAEWSLTNVEQCVARQRDILRTIWPCLKTNGVLIYGTCTYNSHENEENVRWLCDEFGAEIQQIAIDKTWQITATNEGCHFYPHKTRGEGLFLTVVRKNEAENRTKLKERTTAKKMSTPFAEWLKNADEYVLFEHKGSTFAFAKMYADCLQMCLNRLHVLHFGVALAEQKGKDLIPQPSLALSKALNISYFNTVELPLEKALAFLRTESFPLPDAPRGFLLVTYENLPIGWLKNVGSRCNNLYPSAWRIRMTI